MKLTYDVLRKTMLRGMPEDAIITQSLNGIINCCEKLNMTADQAFDQIAQGLNKQISPSEYEPYKTHWNVEDIELD